MKPYLIILYFIAFVVLSALSDALSDEYYKVWAHGLEVGCKGMLVFSVIIFKPKKWIPFVIALVAWNAVLFDTSYNLFRGLPWNFIGSTSLWDIFFSNYPIVGLIIVKTLCLALAVHLPIKYLK